MRTFVQKPKAAQQTTSAEPAIPVRAHFGSDHEVNSILHLQRTIGNQAIQRLLQRHAEERDTVLTGTTSPRFGHDFSRIPVTAGLIQTKLAINKPGDEYEQEADRVADHVMRMPERLQTERIGGSETEPVAASSVVNEVRQSPSQPLQPAVRAFMEPRFGHDFSRVRIHDSASAGEAARRINAEAYTYGQDIHFAHGRYQPDTQAGLKLLAHELSHVVQQTPGVRRSSTYARSLASLSAPTLQAKFVAGGDAAGFAAFANSVIAVQKRVVVSASGEISVQSTDVQGPPTPEAQELVRVLESVINDSHLTTIEFIHGQTSTRASDVNVLGGNYQLSRTDLDDLSALGTQGSVGVGQGRTGGTVLAHEILEQYRKQVHGETFPVAHAAATAAEEVAVGATRGAERYRQVNATTLEVTIPYTYPDGRIVEVTWDIVNGNYQNVRRRVVRPSARP